MMRLIFVLLAASFCATGQIPEFLKWYEGYQGPVYPPDVMKAYRGHLASQGLGESDVEARIKKLQASMQTMPPEFTVLYFNKIYSMPDPPFRQAASQFLARIADGLKPGAALDVAMGQGRNALYLASKGWDVTGYDVADQGLAQAQAAARKTGLTIKTVKASHDEFDYGTARWDLIVETFAFTKLGDDAYRKRVVDSLKPGGVLLIEGFGGGPKNQMIDQFRDLRVLYYEDREDIADWSMQKSRMARIAVRKE